MVFCFQSGGVESGVVDGGRFVMKGRTMKLGCGVWYGMVWYGIVFFFGCGNEREGERGRERSASKQRATMYTFIISHLFPPQHIHSLNHR